MDSKKIALGAVLAALLVAGAFYFLQPQPAPVAVPVVTAAPLPQKEHSVIGQSVEGRAIEEFTFPAFASTSVKHLLLVGGMHGGYEWNSVLLAYKMLDYLIEHPEAIPENVSVTIIPSLNPDGVFKIVKKEGRFTEADVPKGDNTKGDGRFNAHGVDLNRNFDCKWQPHSMWKGNIVSAGTGAFSEPETAALRDYVSKAKPVAVAFWHSQANAVYASECKEGILPETLTLADAYAKAADYKDIKTFDAYPVTGDAEGWLASEHIPAITVELSSHTSLDWDKNLAGVSALLSQYSAVKN